MTSDAPNSRRIARLLDEIADPTTRNGTSMNDSNVDPRDSRTARGWGSIVAVLLVAALVGILWLRGEVVLAGDAGYVGTVATSALAQNAFHTTATESGVPSATHVFASRPPSSQDDTPAAPTF